MTTLSQIHRVGLIHRDISPDNIILTDDGTPVLIDFGAAKQFSGVSTMSVTLKHGYSPPEQYFTKGEQGPWTDVYALCATIYRVTCGKKPPPSLDRLAGTDRLIPPNERGAGFTSQQQRTLLRGLAIEKDNRIQSVRELYDGLYTGAPSSAPAMQRGRQPGGFAAWAESHKGALLAVMFALLCLLTTMAVVAVRQKRQAAAAQPTVPPLSLTTHTPEAEAPAETPHIHEPTERPTATIVVENPGVITAAEAVLYDEPGGAGEELAVLPEGAVVSVLSCYADFGGPGVDYYQVYDPVTLLRGFVSAASVDAAAAGRIPTVSPTPTPRLTPTPRPTPVPTVEPTPTPEPTEALSHPGRVSANELLLRKGPSTDSEIRTTLKKGDVVDLIRKEDGFYYVYVPRLTVRGYVYARYIETDADGDIPHITHPTPTPPAAPTATPTGPLPTPTPPPLWQNPKETPSASPSTSPS